MPDPEAMTAKSPIPRVVVCGGGVAGVEALLALRGLLDGDVETHLVAANSQFVYQPLAVAAPFGLAETHLSDLADIARDAGASLHVDSLVRVDADDRSIQLASGTVLPYDALIIAVGARRRDWLKGALHFGGAANVRAFGTVLDRFEKGMAKRLCFVYPETIGWPLPLYELALLTASRLADRGVTGAELTIVTPEANPLAVFGPSASRMLRELLATRGIALETGAHAEGIEDGTLHLRERPALQVDHVVTLAWLEGPALPGLPADAAGFIAVDEHSGIIGLEDVYAAGDGTSFPVKQGGVASQQADAAAEAIAARIGATGTPSPFRPTLRAMLLTGIAPIYLRAQVAGETGDSFELAANPLWWPPSKVAGRYLAPYLAGRSPLTRSEVLEDRPPSREDPLKLRRRHDEARELALTFAERDAAQRDFESALHWLDVLERIDGVLPPGFLHKRAIWQSHAHEES
jgi:sulfide:quinone oxidoreductase